MSVSTKPGVYQTLEGWRGLASLWVVMYHMTLVLLVSYPQLHLTPLYTLSLKGSLGVQIFFVISGYCIANAACKTVDRKQGFFQFMRARIRRIYPPVWFALIFATGLSISAALLVASHHLKSSTLGSENVLHQGDLYFFSNFTLTQPIIHQPFMLIQCWTLCYEMAFYLLVGLFLIPAIRGKGRFPLLPSLHLVTSVTLLLLILVPHRVNYPMDLWPQFGMGVVAYDVLTNHQDWKPKAWLGGIGTLFVVFWAARSYNIGVMGEPSRLTFLFSLLFTGLLIGLYKHESHFRGLRPVQALSALGLFSYSLYLTHTLCIGIVNQFVKAFHVPASLHYLVFAVFIATTITFARIFFHFFERPFIGSAKKPVAGVIPSAVALEAG